MRFTDNTAGIVTRTSVDEAGRILGALLAGVNAVLFYAIVLTCLRGRSRLLAAVAAPRLPA